MAKVRTEKGTLNLRGISRRELSARGTDTEFARELGGFLANPTGGGNAQAGRVGANEGLANRRGQNSR